MVACIRPRMSVYRGFMVAVCLSYSVFMFSVNSEYTAVISVNNVKHVSAHPHKH